MFWMKLFTFLHRLSRRRTTELSLESSNVKGGKFSLKKFIRTRDQRDERERASIISVTQEIIPSNLNELFFLSFFFLISQPPIKVVVKWQTTRHGFNALTPLFIKLWRQCKCRVHFSGIRNTNTQIQILIHRYEDTHTQIQTNRY